MKDDGGSYSSVKDDGRSLNSVKDDGGIEQCEGRWRGREGTSIGI